MSELFNTNIRILPIYVLFPKIQNNLYLFKIFWLEFFLFVLVNSLMYLHVRLTYITGHRFWTPFNSLYALRTASGIDSSSIFIHSCTTVYVSLTSGSTDFIDLVRIALLRNMDHVINQFRDTRVHVTYVRVHIIIALLTSR